MQLLRQSDAEAVVFIPVCHVRGPTAHEQYTAPPDTPHAGPPVPAWTHAPSRRQGRWPVLGRQPLQCLMTEDARMRPLDLPAVHQTQQLATGGAAQLSDAESRGLSVQPTVKPGETAQV